LEGFQFIYHVHKIIKPSTVYTTCYKNTLKHIQTNKHTKKHKRSKQICVECGKTGSGF